MADAPALGAGAAKAACRFDPDLAYQTNFKHAVGGQPYFDFGWPSSL